MYKYINVYTFLIYVCMYVRTGQKKKTLKFIDLIFFLFNFYIRKSNLLKQNKIKTFLLIIY